MLLNDYTQIDKLVEQVKQKNTDALWKLYDYYKPIINFTSNKIHQKYPTIEYSDLHSECIFILQDLCIKYDKEKCYFSYYFNARLMPYLVSKVKSKYLEKVNVTCLDDMTKSEMQDDINFKIEDYTFLHIEIEKLPVKMQEIIDLFYFKNLTQSECAKILKISQPAFNKKLSKVLSVLRKNIQKEL
jgi:RNA polymerase sigma factor (sigma-70 family)